MFLLMTTPYFTNMTKSNTLIYIGGNNAKPIFKNRAFTR